MITSRKKPRSTRPFVYKKLVRQFRCPFCDVNESSSAQLQQHMDTTHHGWVDRAIAKLGLHVIAR
jgi:transcription elongation factor Elf1